MPESKGLTDAGRCEALTEVLAAELVRNEQFNRQPWKNPNFSTGNLLKELLGMRDPKINTQLACALGGQYAKGEAGYPRENIAQLIEVFDSPKGRVLRRRALMQQLVLELLKVDGFAGVHNVGAEMEREGFLSRGEKRERVERFSEMIKTGQVNDFSLVEKSAGSRSKEVAA